MVNSRQTTVCRQSTDHCKFLEPQPLFLNRKAQKVGISAVWVVRALFPEFQTLFPLVFCNKVDNHRNQSRRQWCDSPLKGVRGI